MNTKNFRYTSYDDNPTSISIELKRAGMFVNQYIGHYHIETKTLYLDDTRIVRDRLLPLAQHFNIDASLYRYGRSLMSFNSWNIELTFKPTIKRQGMQYYRLEEK